MNLDIIVKSQKLNIKKIAELAGVSISTVSRVLNDYPHISTEFRDKVMRVVKETGYERNYVARMLRTNRSNMIGLVIPSGAEAVFTDPYFPVLTRDISLTAKKNDLTLALFLCESEQDGEETIKSIIANSLLDGIVITADYKNNTFEAQLTNGDMPYIFIGKPQNDELASYIDTDNFSGGVMATEYLIQQGYQRIAIIGSAKNTSANDRYRGYCHALEKHNISFDPSLFVYGDYTMNSGTQGMYDLLDANPDAVFVTSDTMALGAIRALRERGISIPEEVAIVGYDDLPPAIQTDPQLTTIRQPISRTGELAVETLLQIIESPDQPPRQIILPNELIVRASTK